MEAARVIEIVGGERAIGSSVLDERDLIRTIRDGLPVDTAEFVVESGRLSRAELDQVVIPRKTLSHRRRIGRLTREQSDRLIRVARVIALAEETFGSADKAHLWLRRQTTALDDTAPLDLLDTSEGATQVEVLLQRIAFGIAA